MSGPLVHVDPPELFGGVPYHYATVVGPGSLLFAAGACPLDEQGATVAPHDVAAQTARAAANLFATLAAAGSSPSLLVRTTLYVASAERADLVTAWEVLHGLLGPTSPPSTLLGVACLGYSDQLVEIDAVARLGPSVD